MFKRLSTLLLILLIPSLACAAKTNFVDGNKATGTKGTVVTAAFLNGINNHRHDGAASDGSGVLDYYVDSGNINNVVITPSPALADHVVGMPIWVKVAAANTGSAAVTVGSLAQVPLRRLDGSALQKGDLVAGAVVAISYDGSGYRVLNAVATNANTVGGDRLVHGYVAADGTATFGTGGKFTVSRTGTGTYSISYATSFSGSVADILATPMGLAGVTASVTGAGTNTAVVTTYGSSGSPLDAPFFFLAIGAN